MGFLSRVMPVADFDREFAAYCELVAENAPLTLAAAKIFDTPDGIGPAARDLDKARA